MSSVRHPLAVTSLGLLVLVLGLAPVAAAALDVPYLTARVNDLADIVSPETESRIEARLSAFEEATGSQIAVLTIPSLEGEALEDFSLRVAETWQLGRAEVDDGVLLLVARDDRKMRIEVGYGLEGSVPDALAGRILDQVVRPQFRAGDFDGGIESGVDSIITAIEGGDPLPPASQRSVSGNSPNSCGPVFMAFMVLLIMVPTLIGLSAQTGKGAWLSLVIQAIFFAFIAGSILGFVAGIVTFFILMVLFGLLRLFISSTSLGKSFAKWARSNSGRSWSTGRGGGFSGGGFSGGGFSGGGGSFGGGGSSSSW